MINPNNTRIKAANHVFGLFSVKTTSFVLAALSMSFATTSTAEWVENTDWMEESDSTSGSTTTYVDSVHNWGAWGLDIEPAAGGIQQQSVQALNARDSKVTLRTNSIAALGPAIPAIPAVPATPATPTTPAVPAVPAIPAITPINPNVPIPVGGPGDGF